MTDKKNFYWFVFGIIISLSMIVVTRINAEVRYIRHYEHIKPAALQFTNKYLPKKIDMNSSTKGEIMIRYGENIPDSIKIAITVAKEMWEAKLHNKKTIFIDVYYEPLDNETAICTEISMEEFDNIFYPEALVIQNSKYPRDPSNTSSDGNIIINSDLNWDCNYTNQNISAYHLPTMILRGIARCLGFISCIEDYGDNNYGFADFLPSIFDDHLYHGSSSLSSIDLYSPRMADFITSNQVTFNTGLNKYAIYAPKAFKNGESLCYLKEENFLMSQSLGKGNTLLNIDTPTIDILNAIGWNLPYEDLKIECLDIDKTGIGSSYKSHVFILAENNLNIESYAWSFSLKNKTGIYENICNGNRNNFTIEKITNNDRYYINSNGDLEGKIECEYTINGKTHYAEPFKISLEQKPQIFSISDVTRTWNNYDFILDFNVQYAGTDVVTVKVEEEYDYYVRSYRSIVR